MISHDNISRCSVGLSKMVYINRMKVAKDLEDRDCNLVAGCDETRIKCAYLQDNAVWKIHVDFKARRLFLSCKPFPLNLH